jgi:hypothetical protein
MQNTTANKTQIKNLTPSIKPLLNSETLTYLHVQERARPEHIPNLIRFPHESNHTQVFSVDFSTRSNNTENEAHRKSLVSIQHSTSDRPGYVTDKFIVNKLKLSHDHEAVTEKML